MKEILIPIGKRIEGEPVLINLAEARNVLIAGKDESDKSEYLKKVVDFIVNNKENDDVKLILIDLNCDVFSKYNGDFHLKYPVLTKKTEAIISLDFASEEIKNRKATFNAMRERGKSVFNINDYNSALNNEEKICNIVIIVFGADSLLQDDEGLKNIERIASVGRGAGVHLVISINEISENVIEPSLKTVLQTRICFATSSEEESLYVIHKAGAEKLRKGERLYLAPTGGEPSHFED